MAFPIASPAWSGPNPAPAYSGVFIPEIWSGKLVEKFYAATVLGAIANTDYEGEIRNQGDLVKIRTRTTIPIADYEANQDLAIQRPSSNLVELLIDKVSTSTWRSMTLWRSSPTSTSCPPGPKTLRNR